MTGYNRYEPPSPSTQGDENLEETFLKNVEYFHDILPQPFRRINKIVDDIFEEAWMTIEQHKNEIRYVDNFHQNIEKVVYEEDLLVNDKLQSITACGDYIIAFGDIGISVYKLPEFYNCAKCSYKDFIVTPPAQGSKEEIGDNEEKIEEQEKEEFYITDSCIITFKDDSALMAILNSKSECEIYGFKTDFIHFVTRLTIQAGGNDEGVKIEQMYLAEDSSYLAFSSKGHPQNKNSLIIYKLETDEWMNVLSCMKSSKELEEETGRNESTQEDTTEEVPQSTVSSIMRHQQQPNFVKPLEILKIYPTVMTPNNASTLTSAMKDVDINSNMIGNGSHHILSRYYFENLQRQFQGQFNIQESEEDIMKSLETVATCHFVEGRLTTSLFPSASSIDIAHSTTIGIAVWWKHSNVVSVYSLTSGKDCDHSLVSLFPHAYNIALTAVNKRTDLLAVALNNHCVTLWNRFTGEPLKTFLSPENQPLNLMRFSTASLDNGTFRSVLTFGTTAGKLWQMKCDSRDVSELLCLDHRCTSLEMPDRVMKGFEGVSNMLAVVWASGQVIMYNEVSCQPICQLELFNDEKQLHACPINIHLAFAANNRFVALRDESTDVKKCSRLFSFESHNHPSLQKFHDDSSNTTFDDSDENIYDLDTYFAHFLRKRKNSEDALMERLASYRREFSEQGSHMGTAKS